MASAEADENDLKDHMIFSSKSHATPDTPADYGHVEENFSQQEEWMDLKNSHSPCLDDDFKSTSQESFSRVSSIDTVSNNACQPDVILNRMSSESDANKDDTADGLVNQEAAQPQITEYVYLNRLPGENLGMVLGIEGDLENRLAIDVVVVKSVTPVGAVARSCQGTNRIIVGDEIREIDGRPLNQLTHDQCIALFEEMPDNVVLTIYRKDKHSESHEESSAYLTMPKAVKRKGVPTVHPRIKHVYSETCTIDQEEHIEEVSQLNSRFSDASNSGGKRQADLNDYSVPKGFTRVDVTICRRDGDNFGLSVVPSYGATCDLYQIKRLVHSGASAQSGLLEVGDRLLACNDQSLKGLTQSQCLNVLKSSGALIKLTVLRPTTSKEDTQLAVVSVSARIHQTPSCSNDSTEITVAQDIVEGSSELSRNIPEDQTEHETVNDTQIQEHITTNNSASENSGFVDNIDDIQVLDSKTTINTERIVHKEKNGLLFINIPPPGEFSDADSLNDIEFTENRTDSNGTATNVNDLLFAAVPHTSSSNSEAYSDVLSGTNSETDDRVSVLTLLDQKSDYSPTFITLNASRTDSTDDAFTGQSIEEFANECFNDINDTELEKVSRYTPQQSSKTGGAALTNDLLHIADEQETCIFSNSADRVTTLPYTSSNDYDSKLPLTDLLEFESHRFSECNSVQLSSDSDTHHTFNTNILEHSQPGVSKSHVHGLSDGHVIKEETFSPAVNIKHHSSSILSNTSEGISIQTPSTVTVDESCPVLADVNSHLNNPIVCTPVGVTTMFESREQGEVMEPTVITYNEGTLPSIPSQQPIEEPPHESSILDTEKKPEIAGIHSALTTASVNPIWSVTTNSRIIRDISEEERVPTLQTVGEKENALDALKRWTSEISSNNAATFRIAASGILDTQRKAYEQSLPENAVVHTTVGVSNAGQEENVIEPMISAKDNQGRQFYIPSFSSEQKNVDVYRPDHHAKLELVNVISSLVSLQPSVSRSEQRAQHAGDLVIEDAIVPTVLSCDEKRMVASALDAWVNDNDRSGKSSTVQRAVTGFKINQKQANATSASLFSAKSFEAKIVKEHNNDNKQNNNADINASTKGKELPSMLISTENIDSINKVENIAKKSAREFNESSDIKLTSKQPEVNVRSDLNKSDNHSPEPSTHQTSDHVILRKKLGQSADFNAQADKIEQSTDASSAYITRRPRSMIVTSSTAVSRFEDLHKSATTDSKPVSTFRPLSALRPLSSSTASLLHHSSTSLNRPASRSFSSSTFASKVSKSDYPKVRQEDGSPFQVDVIKGIVGLGFKVKVTPEGSVQVTEVTRGGPVDKDGQIHIGDNIVSINSTELTGQTDARVQQILRLLPRGLTKLVVSSGVPAASESQSRIVDSSCNSPVLSTQSYMADALRSSPSLNNDSLQVTLSQRKSHSSKTEDTFPSHQVNPYIKTADSLLGASDDHVSEKIELTSKSSEKSVPADALEDIIPAVSPKHDHFASVVPRQDLPHLANETHVGVNTRQDLPHLANETHVGVNTRQDLPHLANETHVGVNTRQDLPHLANETHVGVNTRQDLPHLANETHVGVNTRLDLPHLANETHVGVNTRLDLPHLANETHVGVNTRLDLPHLANETHVGVNKNLILNQSQDSTELQVLNTGPIALQRQSSKNDESIVCEHQADSKSDAELLNQDNPIEHTENSSNSVSHPELLCDISPLFSNNQDASIIYSSLSSQDLSQSQDFDRTEIKRQGTGVSIFEETNDHAKHPPLKVPPPVAPKPRLSPASVKRTEDSVDGSQPIWPPLRKTVGDDKLHDDYKLSKPAVADKASSFVSLTAKMFDDKTASSNSIVNKTLITRQVSREMVAHTDSSNVINTSHLPTHDWHKHTLTKSSVSLSHPSTLSRPRTLNYTAAASKDVPTEDDFTKFRENVDHKTNSVLSPTQLNSALSPRRKPSFDFPTSPPFNTLNKHAPEVTDEPPHRVDSGQSKSIHQVGIYQTTPLALLTDKPPSLVFSKDKPTPRPEPALPTADSGHRIKSLASHTSSSLSVREEAMKQFENLLLDDELSSETPEISQTVERANIFDTQIADIQKPVALPRRKVEHKPGELKVENKDSEELNPTKFKEETDTTQNKLTLDVEKECLHQFAVENSVSVNMASEIRDFPEERSTNNITDKISEYNGTSLKNISIETTEITEVSVTANNEIKQANNISEIDTNVYEINNKITADSTENHEQSWQRDLRMIDLNHEFDQPEERTIGYEETSESFRQHSLTSCVNSAVSDNKQDKGFEANEAHPEFLEAYANQIVEELMKKIVNNPGALSTVENTNIAEISTSPGLFEEEPPPLPDHEPPVPASPAHSLRNTDLLINAEDLMNQAEFRAVNKDVTTCLDRKIQSEGVSVKEQYAVTNPAQPEVNTNNESLVVITQPEVNEENKTAIVESIRSLDFSNSDVYSPDAIDVSLKSPLDLLSEDSGMPADEDQDVATDDAISPPSEFMEIGSHVVKKVPFSVTNDVELSTMSTSTQEWDNLMTDSACSSKISTDDLLGDMTYDNYNKAVSDNGVYRDNVGPLLSTTSTSTRAIVNHSGINYAEDLLSNHDFPPMQSSVPTQLPSEISLFWDNIPTDGSVETAQQVPMNKVTPETKHQLATPYQDNATTASVSLSDASFQDTDLLKPVDIPSMTVASKRKWCLTSYRSRSPLLSGDHHVPVDLHCQERTLMTPLPPDHLRFVIMKANALLDAVSAPDSMVLIVVHIHSSDDCTPLVFDIGHKGGIWFQVSGLRGKSNLFEGDGIEDGDWLLSVADEWCDQATLASFQSKLVNWTHDQLLVFARGRIDIKEAVPTRPLPTPRSRSFEKRNSDQKIVNKAEYEDFIDAAPQYHESIHSEKLPSLAEKASLIPAQAQLLLDEQPKLPDKAPPLLDEAPPLLDDALPLLDEAPPLPYEAPPFPYKAPPLPDQAPPLPDQAPPLPDQAPPLPDQAPPLPDQAPPLSDQAPLLPGLKTPCPDQIPSLLDQTPSLIDQTLLVPDKAPPISDHELTLLEQIEQLSDKKSSFQEQAPSIPDQELTQLQQTESRSYQRPSFFEQKQTIPDPEQPLLKQKDMSSNQQSSVSDQAASLPAPVTRLLDKVIVKETLPFLDEKNKTLPDKTPRVVHETQKILAKTQHTEADGEDKVTVAKYNINGGQEASSSAQVKSSPEKPPRVKENLPAVKSRNSVSSSDELAPGIHTVTMIKGATGVGFCIEGGVGSPKGDMPIIIKRIFKGGPAEKCGHLKVRDEILEVNGVKFHSMRHFEAWNHLKFLDDGAVHITLQRPSS